MKFSHNNEPVLVGQWIKLKSVSMKFWNQWSSHFLSFNFELQQGAAKEEYNIWSYVFKSEYLFMFDLNQTC